MTASQHNKPALVTKRTPGWLLVLRAGMRSLKISNQKDAYDNVDTRAVVSKYHLR